MRDELHPHPEAEMLGCQEMQSLSDLIGNRFQL